MTPGHVFPLVARDGGTLERTGHTEAAVDLARLAGLTPAGVICEIMNDDGTMARRNDLIAFAQKHNLKIGTISDLIAYRRRYDSIVRRLSENTFDSVYGGDFRCVIYVNKVTMAQHIALVKGDPAHGGPVMVRMHAVNIFTDLLGQRDTGRGGEIEASMREIAKEGRGVVVLIREPPTVMLSEQRRRAGERIEPAGGELRDYGVGAQILIDLGVKEMVLLTNSKKSVVGLEGFGLKIVGQKPIPRPPRRDRRSADMSTRTETPTARPAVDGVKGARILIVESRYYADIADALISGAEREIKKNGAVSGARGRAGRLRDPWRHCAGGWPL